MIVYVLTYEYYDADKEIGVDEYVAVYATRAAAEKAAQSLTRWDIHETLVIE